MPEEIPSEAPKTVHYGSNSKASKDAAVPDRPVPEQIVTGEVVARKKGIGTRFRESFGGDSAGTVGQYLVLEVILPAVKNLIFDLGTEALKRSLFGGTRSGVGVVSSSILGSRTNYQAFGSRATPAVAAAAPPGGSLSPQQRAMHDFSGVILQSREQGLEVIDQLSELIETYGTATVNDFYAMVGLSSEFTNVKYGWKSLAQAQVRHIREGYLLDMPKPIVLE